MNVLQATLCVVLWLHTEILLHLLIPDLRHIIDVDLALDETLLNLEAEDNVHRIGDLVGLNADERGSLDDVDSGVQVLRTLVRGEGSREGRSKLRHEVLRKGLAEAHHSLPEQGLALVHGHARRGADRQAIMLGVAALLVEGMPCLVDRSRQPLHDVSSLKPRGHAHVCGVSSASERMHAHIQTALAKVETQGQGNLLAELRLLVGVKIALEPRRIRRRALLTQLGEEGHQPLLDLVEDLLDPRRRQPCGVVIGQHVVRRLARVHKLGALAARRHPLLQHRGKDAPVLLLARLNPRLVAAALELRLSAHEVLRHSRRLPVVASRLAHCGTLVVIQGRLVTSLQPGQDVAQRGVRLLAVDDAGQRALLRRS
mmetsp:Transcript_85698/g.227709  ORF Transcript_85698/g.227709 Transcript_85698/m.227709 type:complete len:370 (+) Transcript_85698:383-1492(+)